MHEVFLALVSYMDVSENSGTPKSSILIGFSIINHPFWGFSPYFGKQPYIFHDPPKMAFLGRHIIAVEPLDFRRTLAATGAFGATMAVKPGDEAIEAVKKLAPKGADVVLEMVGHNQDGSGR